MFLSRIRPSSLLHPFVHHLGSLTQDHKPHGTEPQTDSFTVPEATSPRFQVWAELASLWSSGRIFPCLSPGCATCRSPGVPGWELCLCKVCPLCHTTFLSPSSYQCVGVDSSPSRPTSSNITSSSLGNPCKDPLSKRDPAHRTGLGLNISR